MHTGVKSFGCEKSTAHESPIQSWKPISPSVVCAVKSGAVSLIVRAIFLPFCGAATPLVRAQSTPSRSSRLPTRRLNARRPSIVPRVVRFAHSDGKPRDNTSYWGSCESAPGSIRAPCSGQLRHWRSSSSASSSCTARSCSPGSTAIESRTSPAEPVSGNRPAFPTERVRCDGNRPAGREVLPGEGGAW